MERVAVKYNVHIVRPSYSWYFLCIKCHGFTIDCIVATGTTLRGNETMGVLVIVGTFSEQSKLRSL